MSISNWIEEKMKLKILATLLLFSGIAAVGASLPESLNLQKDGTFSFH